MFTASRLGEVGAGPHTLKAAPSHPQTETGGGGRGAVQAIGGQALGSARTLALRDSRPSRTPNQCKRLIVQIEFERDGGQSHGRLASPEQRKRKRKK